MSCSKSFVVFYDDAHTGMDKNRTFAVGWNTKNATTNDFFRSYPKKVLEAKLFTDIQTFMHNPQL